MAGKSTDQAVSLLFMAAAFTTAILWLHSVAAEGALAVGAPADIAKDGYATGYSYNAKDKDAARATAMEYCRKAPTGKKAIGLCKVIETFSNRCVAVSMDPKAGTPGAGWGIADDLHGAERLALSKCEATAGPARRGKCELSNSHCDGHADAGNRCETLSGDAAITACDEAIRQDPQSAANYNNRAFEYRNKVDTGRALTDINKAIELNPKYGKAYFNRGLIYLYGGKPDKALADINQASELNRKDAFNALWVDIASKRSNLPSRLAQTVAQVDMTDWPAPVIRLFLGQMTPGAVLAAADDPDIVVKTRRVCDANFFIGELALQQGTKEEAMRSFRIAATGCPKDRVAGDGARGELKVLSITP